MSSSEQFTVEVARDSESVSQLRLIWERMSPVLHSHLDFYLAILRSRTEIVRPHILVVKQHGQVRSILVCRIEERPFEVAVAYKKIALRKVRLLVIVEGGLLGDDSEECVSALVASLQNSLAAGEADIASFHAVDTRSTFYRVARTAGGTFTRDRYPTPNPHWKLHLPARYDDLIARRSASSRNQFKRYEKRLRGTFADELSVRIFRDIADMDRFFADSETIAVKTYHRGLGVGFVDNSEMRELFGIAARKGWFRGYILYLRGTPVAFWNAFLFGQTLFTGHTGFDPEYREYRVGRFLMHRMLEDVYRENIASIVDFGLGDADYKKEWCDTQHLDSSFFLFAPTFTGVSLNSVRTPIAFISQTARAVLTQVGGMSRIKRAWRDWLSAKDVKASSYQQ